MMALLLFNFGGKKYSHTSFFYYLCFIKVNHKTLFNFLKIFSLFLGFSAYYYCDFLLFSLKSQLIFRGWLYRLLYNLFDFYSRKILTPLSNLAFSIFLFFENKMFSRQKFTVFCINACMNDDNLTL